MDDEQFARYLYEEANHLTAPPNSKDWWLDIARAGREYLSGAVEEIAAGLIERELGATEVSNQKPEPDRQQEIAAKQAEMTEPTHSAIAPPGAGVHPRSAAHRTMCSQRATFDRAVPLDRRFRPSMYGYSGEDFARDYPHANPGETLERFFAHHLGKGDVSKNWLEKFWTFALTANRIARERAADKTSTDSMGQPLDPAERARRVQVARQHEREQNAYIDEQMAVEAAERESQQP
jgi:hypothetical protein